MSERLLVHEPSEEVHLPPPNQPRKRFGWIKLLVIIALAAGAFFWYRQHQTPATQADGPNRPPQGGGGRAVPAGLAMARQGDMPVYVEALGTVTPVYTATVTSRVQGEVMNVYYKEGQLVHKGDPLVDIDARPYQAVFDQAQGQLARDQAILAKDRVDLDRYKTALSRNAIAKQQVDDQEQVVLQDQGTVKNDEGTVEAAQANLIYCHITSAIDGRVGLRLVDPGNIIGTNSSTPLVVVTQLEPITVIFSVAEDYLPQIQQQVRQGHSMRVDAFDRTQEKQIASGTLLTIDNVIDTTTGTAKLRAIFPNQDDALFPNQFVNAKLLVDTKHDVAIVPTAAIQRNAQNAFVYVVDKDQVAHVTNVTAGTTNGDETEVDGISPDSTIVVAGFDKLQDGIKVATPKPPGEGKGGGKNGGGKRGQGGGQGQGGQQS